jgi:SAM-dependent methyltransferase
MAAMQVRDLTRCLICGSESLRSARFAYWFAETEFPGVTCTACGFTFLSRQPANESLAQLYAAEYFDSDYHCGHEAKPYFACEEGQVESSNVLLGWIEEATRPGRILEVGCAGGYFLKAAKDRGWDPIGVEISARAAEFARESLGLHVHTGTLASAHLPAESVDAAYLGDVLEHLPDPMAALAELERVLRPGGVLLIAGPITINSLDRRLGLAAYQALARTKLLRQPPYHLLEFTPATLADALSRAGFRVRWIRERKIPPVWRNVRKRSPVEHLAKLALDGPNWLITQLSGKLGDRAIVLAIRE